MKIIVGKYAGFCNGARTAVEKTNEALEGEHPYSIGEIIHNEEVINYLKQRGLIVKDSISKQSFISIYKNILNVIVNGL